MPNIDTQYNSFLGGEVSPRLHHRVDMDKFSKWFDTAENIRFMETGSFRNRAGFQKIANTKNNTAGEIIKLLSFSFNDEESFLVELGVSEGSGYARFFKDGEPIIVNNEIYEISSPITTLTNDDIKYAQAGDTIFITSPTDGIFELRRLNIAGTNWEFRKFQAEILPLNDINDDSNHTLTLESLEQSVSTKKVTIPLQDNEINSFITFTVTLDETTAYSINTEKTFDTILTELNDALSSYGISVTKEGNVWSFYSEIYDQTDIETISITYKSPEKAVTIDSLYETRGSAGYKQGRLAYLEYSGITRIEHVEAHYENDQNFFETDTITGADIEAQLQYLVSLGDIDEGIWNAHFSFVSQYGQSAPGTIFLVTNRRKNDKPYPLYFTFSGVLFENGTSSSVDYLEGQRYQLTETPNASFFMDKQVGEVVCVKNQVEAQIIKGSKGVVSDFTTEEIFSDGGWRFVTSGSWVGTVEAQYSADNKKTWHTLTTCSSTNKDVPSNINTSGVLTSDGIVYFRLVINVTEKGSYDLSYTFEGRSFIANSYYKISKITSPYQADVICIKNDVGEFENNSYWYYPAFSKAVGYPSVIGFYQNRLFLGKDYRLYGSRTNDFWDFYVPASNVSADDPVDMSLLSYKVNSIKNIITHRSFFTFTGGGEFGIGSEGALTQQDKYMKQFSSHGSATCNLVQTGDVIMFVDKTQNTVRALRYSLESDGYEANDVTILLKQLLEDEKFFSTEYLFNDKEALFLSTSGKIFVSKYLPEQNVLAWSHFKHAKYKITNVCVVPNGSEQDLYIAVDTEEGKQIEKLSKDVFLDSYITLDEVAEGEEEIEVPFEDNTVVTVLQDGLFYKQTVEDGEITLRIAGENIIIGLEYVSTATLLEPTIPIADNVFSTYNSKRPYKVRFIYNESVGFKVGVKEEEKFEVEWQPVPQSIDNQYALTSGKKSVLISGRFDGSSKVSFVQDRPFPMEVTNILLETDYGGK